MKALAVAAAAAAAFLITTGHHRSGLGERISAYLAPVPPGTTPPVRPRRRWSPEATRRILAAITGGIVGALVGWAGPSATGFRSVLGLGLAGAAAGFLAVKVAATQRREARRRMLRQELPTVADALALSVLAGDSIPAAIDRLCSDADGVVADELRTAMERHGAGIGLGEALGDAAGVTDHPDAARLYEALAHAHHTGGRLSETLAALATDFRAAVARDLLAEGGKRALAAYGPILALQIPVTLLFLMYPTLVGLGELSATP
jgi:tight adherence protein C